MLAGASLNSRNKPVILMDHQPHRLEEAEQAGVVLQMSGHTHYGQVWPANYIIEAMYENPKGLSSRGKTYSSVSVGAGTWGPPIRNTARPEVVILQLHFTDADSDM